MLYLSGTEIMFKEELELHLAWPGMVAFFAWWLRL
jgi:hypothetical protein